MRDIRARKFHHPEEEPTFFSRQIADARRFYLRLKEPWPETFNVVCGGREHCTPDYKVQRNDFPFVTVEFVAQGKGLLSVRGEPHPLTPGAIFVYGPGTPHTISCGRNHSMVKYFAAFSGTAVPQKFSSLAPSTGVMVQTAVPERIAEVFEQLIDAGMGDTPFRDHACRLIGELLLLRIAETAVPPGTVDTVAFETFVRCRSWIDQHYLEVEGLADICDSCGVHQGHLCKLFKRYARKSPWQHVLGLKMRDAAHRLQTPNILVREVAAALGYADPYQFSRTFHRVLGTWPRTLVHLREQRG